MGPKTFVFQKIAGPQNMLSPNSKQPPDTSRQPPGTFQTPTRHQPDMLKAPTGHAQETYQSAFDFLKTL